MSLLVNGVWQPDWFATESEQGEFIREDAQFRHWITADGKPGPSGEGGFAAEPDRYHLYVSLACPWAHRTLIFRALKGLEELISVDVVHPYMGERGWSFEKTDGADGDSLYNSQFMHELYTRADPAYTGIVTVPVLWDKKRETIVNNESAEIIRMFNQAFNHLTGNTHDFYPESLQHEIDAINAPIYDEVNNGVYRTGFATSQAAYEAAFGQLFSRLDQLDTLLEKQRYLLGDRLTEADWRLFTTLVRFDAVYVGHFKCNRNRLVDFPHLWAYTRDLYQMGASKKRCERFECKADEAQRPRHNMELGEKASTAHRSNRGAQQVYRGVQMPSIASTTNMTHIKQHYYQSHDWINPTGIVPLGPEINFSAPHQRDELV